MGSLNAEMIIKECKMSGEAVAEIVASHGEDEFIHVADIEGFAGNHDRLVEENAELREMLSRDKTAFINQIELDLIKDSAKQETRELAESISQLLAKHNKDRVMKTYETEKHNIPDGATHYQNETDQGNFAWRKGVGSEEFMVKMLGDDDWGRERESLYIDYLKPIPQTKEVEWEVFHGESWIPCIRFGNDIYGNHAYQLSDGEFKGEFNGAVEESCFRKLETQEDREKRERMESAYDLHLTRHQGMTAPYHYDEFLKNDQTLNGFLAIVDKTGYRKGGK